MDKEARLYLEGIEQQLASNIASVKTDVGSLTADTVSVKSDVVSLRAELVAMEVRLIPAIDHSQEVLTQVVKRGFDDSESQFRENHTRCDCRSRGR